MSIATLRPAAIDDTPMTERYARCIAASRRVRWDIERDVLRGRRPDFARKFMPDSLSRVRELDFLRPNEARFLSQVQGRTYANFFGLLERFIGARILDLSRHHWLGDQVALEALVRFADEELKHQELFRRLEALCAAGMAPGYAFIPRANEVAALMLSRCTWAALAVTLGFETLTQAHYRSSIEPDPDLSELWKEVFLHHWMEEAQHAILDELEWRHEDARLSPVQRDAAVDDFITLLGALDGILEVQSRADAEYFVATAGRAFTPWQQEAIACLLLRAYRGQFIASGMLEPRFGEVLRSLATPEQMRRIAAALGPAMHAER